jgi:hypothetical protein
MEMVQISKEEYEQLLEQQAKLTALEVAGVDNWDGYAIAMEIYTRTVTS